MGGPNDDVMNIGVGCGVVLNEKHLVDDPRTRGAHLGVVLCDDFKKAWFVIAGVIQAKWHSAALWAEGWNIA